MNKIIFKSLNNQRFVFQQELLEIVLKKLYKGGLEVIEKLFGKSNSYSKKLNKGKRLNQISFDSIR